MNISTPSEYIKKYGKHRDIHSLENMLSIYRMRGRDGMDSLCHQVLTTPKNFDSKLDKDIWDIVFEFLAEIQYAERTLIKWKKEIYEK